MRISLDKKRLLLFFCILILLTCSDVCRSSILNIPQRYQEEDQWCWAATSQSVLEYYEIYKTQSQIAQYGTNGANTGNWLFGSTTNPTRNGIDLILYHFAKLITAKYSSSLSLTKIQFEINANRPIFIRWGWDNGGGHIVVNKGIIGDKMYLMDPWHGPSINTFSWVNKGGSHTWTHTLTISHILEPLPFLFLLLKDD